MSLSAEMTQRAGPPTPDRSDGDRFMRRLLRLAQDAPSTSILGAQNAFRRSILISAVRCMITYVLLPISRPVLGLSGSAGPALGLVVGVISIVAVVLATRRFFASDHRYRWRYTAVAAPLLVLLLVQTAVDIRVLGAERQ